MQLTALRAESFRNLTAIDLRLPEGMTLVGGGNGHGKTSLLEAIYLLGTGRSFRTRRTDDLVRWKAGSMSVAGRVERKRGPVDLAVRAGGGERVLQVNGADRGLEAFLGWLDVVDLTEPRMAVLRGAPVERRRFLDRGVTGLEPAHLRRISEYRLVLQQRNALLRRGGGFGHGPGQLDAWDERLIAAAGGLHLARRRYAADLGARLGSIGGELLPDGGAPRLGYRASPPELGETPEDRIEAVMAERLARCRERDREMGYTTEGPHRDDMSVTLDGIDLRRFGSAGQVRAAMVALKLGKLSLLGEGRGESPLFLLDDFDSDLDDARMGALSAFLSRGGFQAVVATSKEDVIDRSEGAALRLRMERGAARVG